MAYARPQNFVTLEDVFGGQFELNHIVYNCALSKERNEVLLKKITKEVLHIDLTDDETDVLTSYDVHHLQDFIQDYRNTIQRYWDKK